MASKCSTLTRAANPSKTAFYCLDENKAATAIDDRLSALPEPIGARNGEIRESLRPTCDHLGLHRVLRGVDDVRRDGDSDPHAA